MVEIIGFDRRGEALVRQALDMLDASERQHIRRIDYGGDGGRAAAQGSNGNVTIFDGGLCTDGVDLAGYISHENVHAGGEGREAPAVAAQLATLRRLGHGSRADSFEAYALSQEYAEGVDQHFGRSQPYERRMTRGDIPGNTAAPENPAPQNDAGSWKGRWPSREEIRAYRRGETAAPADPAPAEGEQAEAAPDRSWFRVF